MFRQKYFNFLWIIVLFLSAGHSISAQTAPIRGRVELKKADGTVEKVGKATIDVYRTDSKGKLPSGKTDKNGTFGFAGLIAGQTFALVVSAPGIKPEIYPNVKAGMENIVISVYEGDGTKWTEEEVRKALAGSQNSAAGSTDGKAQTEEKPQTSEEQKKAEAEYQRQVAEVTAKNEKIKNSTAIVQKSFAEGSNALKEKNYDLAISKFDEGINADPDFAGSAPVLLNAKGVTLKDRGYASYTQYAKAADAATKATFFESAKKDWTASVDALDKGLAILKTATAPDAQAQKNYDATKMFLLNSLIEVHRLLSKSGIDRSKSAEAKAAYDQYLAVETDPALKAKAQLNLADILRENGDFEGAVAEYRKSLEISPDNPDALAGIGLSLFALGESVQPANLAQEQEGLNYLQRFTEVAPENHPLKLSVKDSVDYLKSKSLTPQKTPKSSTGKKKT